MAILSKGKTFTGTEQVTSTKLHNLVDAATFNDPVDESSLTLDSATGKLKIKDDGVTASKINTDAVTPDAIDQDGGEYLLDDVTAVTTKLTPYVDSAVSGAVTLDLANGNFQQWTLNGNITSVTAPSNLEAGQQFTIWIKNGTGSGPYTWASFDSTWKWFGGTVPDLTATDAAIDVLSGISDGTNVYVTLLKNFA